MPYFRYHLRTIYLAAVLCLCWSMPCAYAQNSMPRTLPATPADSMAAKALPQLADTLNILFNDSVLAGFYKKLQVLRHNPGHGTTVKILHIGDSHIQSDFFSGWIRMELQRAFGHGGRGLVFPYKQAHAYGPSDIYSVSNIKWDKKRNLGIEDSIPLGITGHYIHTAKPDFYLELGIQNYFRHDNTFSQLSLLHGIGSRHRNLEVLTYQAHKTGVPDAKALKLQGSINCQTTGDTLHQTAPRWKLSSIPLDSGVQQVFVRAAPGDSIGKQTVIHGVVLHNSQPGILYHTAGVGGAQLYNFVRTSAFVQQAAALQPDLVIVSLGTNEATNNVFDSLGYQRIIEKLVADIRQQAPGAVFIFTTPPDMVFRRRSPPLLKPIGRAIKRAALQSKSAYWDLNTIMGGSGSMNYWVSTGLATRDRIHFTLAGYQLQGALFIRAFQKSYQKYNTAPLPGSPVALVPLVFPVSAQMLANKHDFLMVMYARRFLQKTLQKTYTRFTGKPFPAASGQVGKRIHIIRYGDTLWDISRAYGVSIAGITTKNKITVRHILRPGSHLRID